MLKKILFVVFLASLLTGCVYPHYNNYYPWNQYNHRWHRY